MLIFNRLSSSHFALLCTLGLFPVTAQNYTFQTFHVPNPPGNNTYGLGINNRGAIVGKMDFRHRVNNFPGSATRGFKLDVDGVFEYPIIAPGDTDYVTEAFGINDSGVIVGDYRDSSGTYHGFIDDNGTIKTVDINGGPGTVITGINNAGDFVGATGPAQSPFTNGYLSHDGVVSEIAFPGAVATLPYGVATDGTIVGGLIINNQDYIFVRGPAGNFKRFQIAGAIVQVAFGVNNAAHLVVGYYMDQSHAFHGFTYDYLSPSFQDLQDGALAPVNTVDYPGAVSIQVHGVNAKGHIVGSAQSATGPSFAFIGTPAP